MPQHYSPQANRVTRDSQLSPPERFPTVGCVTEDERISLESFARCLGVPFEWTHTPKGYVVFPGQRNIERYRGYREFRDAMLFLVISPSTEQGWRESGKLN